MTEKTETKTFVVSAVHNHHGSFGVHYGKVKAADEAEAHHKASLWIALSNKANKCDSSKDNCEVYVDEVFPDTQRGQWRFCEPIYWWTGEMLESDSWE